MVSRSSAEFRVLQTDVRKNATNRSISDGGTKNVGSTLGRLGCWDLGLPGFVKRKKVKQTACPVLRSSSLNVAKRLDGGIQICTDVPNGVCG